ncbi:hypothetical protein [Arcticibacter eurypsychrophilus]|uniref:hypothetical protein n=1 Tax=Arcticibacter eurypsychrophilus TaxID=1434752 RepID=UPI00084D570A|nr:hypothetical protein [Arcticibacter eurypsychrophilus]
MQTPIYKPLFFVLFLSVFFTSITVYSQQTVKQTCPKITGYVAIIHPIVTFNSEGTHTNFNDSYIVGLPTGINIWKSPKIGFSFEMVPFIKATPSGSKTNNLLFHPGVLVALGNGFTFMGRLAFETSGRYGITPAINKVVKKNKGSSFFIALPMPVRFGNNIAATYGLGLQFGLAF